MKFKDSIISQPKLVDVHFPPNKITEMCHTTEIRFYWTASLYDSHRLFVKMALVTTYYVTVYYFTMLPCYYVLLLTCFVQNSSYYCYIFHK